MDVPLSRDHPRLRGEQIAKMVEENKEQGSPPLARGTVKTAIALKAQGGITPACAGNSFGSANSISGALDHPRLRGEQLNIQYHAVAAMGSPPLARGTVKQGLNT